MRTACFLTASCSIPSILGGSVHPYQMQIPLEADHSGSRHQPSHVTSDAWWEDNPRPPLVDRQTPSGVLMDNKVNKNIRFTSKN